MLIFLALASILIGYWISSLVPNELPIGERWFIAATAVFCVPLFFFLVWWKAAIVAGLVLLGWFPALAGFTWAANTETLALTQLMCVLGVLIGTRWRVEKKPFTHLAVAVIILAAISGVVRML